MLSVDRRREIAAFLRTRRARLQPEDVGMPRGARRRTPGLRREEVAVLAGVSPEWYTWLEQARDVRPSAATLHRIGEALRLEPAELQHLLALCGYGGDQPGNGAVHSPTVGRHVQLLLDEFDPCPAWAYGARWDILAWNRAATIVHGDLGAMEGMERNGLHQMFLNPRFRQWLVDWELHARDCVAKVRLAHARHVDDPWFNELVDVLQAKSPEFAAWWDEHNVQLPASGEKIYQHPEVGPLSFVYTTLEMSTEEGYGLHLVTYVPAPGSDTREKLEALIEDASSASGPQMAAAG